MYGEKKHHQRNLMKLHFHNPLKKKVLQNTITEIHNLCLLNSRDGRNPNYYYLNNIRHVSVRRGEFVETELSSVARDFYLVIAAITIGTDKFIQRVNAS